MTPDSSISTTTDCFQVPMVFFRIGWMNQYQGVTAGDEIVGGGEYVKKHGFGFEAFNFRPFEGRYFGYVMPSRSSTAEPAGRINIDRIDDVAKKKESISGVLILWVATHPQGNAYVVGWYKNATLYRSWQPTPDKSQGDINGDPVGYFATTRIADGKLLPIDERVLLIPQRGVGSFGQRNLWYADDPSNETHREIRESVLQLTSGVKTEPKTKHKQSPKQPDTFKRQEVERRAVEVTSAHYHGLGYDIESVEADNVGWDLTATLNKVMLRLEVKGLSGDLLCVEVTPNEYAHMQKHIDSYRLCVVRSALTDPKLDIFHFNGETGYWENGDQVRLEISERVAARCSLA